MENMSLPGGFTSKLRGRQTIFCSAFELYIFDLHNRYRFTLVALQENLLYNRGDTGCEGKAVLRRKDD